MKMSMFLSTVAAVSLLSGCGVETAAVAAGQAEAAVEQAKEAERMKAKIEQDLAAAQEIAAKQREAIDAAE